MNFGQYIKQIEANNKAFVKDLLLHRGSVILEPLSINNQALNKFKKILFVNQNSGLKSFDSVGIGAAEASGIRKYYKRQASDEANRYNTEYDDLDDKIEYGKNNGMSQTQLDNLRQQKKSVRTNYKNMQNVADRHEMAGNRNFDNYYQMGRQELQKLNNRLASYQ